MNEDLVMRSIYLSAELDTQLQQIAAEYNMTRNEVIRAAIGTRLQEWRANPELLAKDLLENGVIPIDERNNLHRVAKAINGPLNTGNHPVAPDHLRQLRQVKWNMLKADERNALLEQAKAVLNELGMHF